MKWCSSALAILLVCAYIPAGNPALSKAAMAQTKNMMKNVCKNKTGVKQGVLSGMAKGEFPDDRKAKCYVACVMGMMQAMKKDKINVSGAIKQVEMLLPDDMKEKTIRQLNDCKDVEGSDGCEIAYNFAKCSYQLEPDHFLLPT